MNMKLVEITEKQKEKFQSLVKINGSFLQDWQWGEFQKSLGRDVRRFAVEEPNENFGGDGGGSNGYSLVGQGYFSEAGGKRYFFMPYGPVIYPGLLQSEKFQQRLDFFCAHLKKLFPDLLFVRFELLEYFGDSELKGAVKTKDINPKKTLVLDISSDEESLMQQMHSKTRYNIRLAAKKGIEVRSSDEISDQQAQLFISTAKRAGVRPFEAEYYKKLVRFFARNENIHAKVYSAWHEGDLLAVNIMLYYRYGFYDNQMTYLFGASADVKRNLMAPYLLHWQAILDAKSEGFRQYDFWGIEEDPKHPWYGFSKFKFGFGGRVGTHAGSYDYVLNSAWYNVYKFLRKVNRLIRK